MDERVESGFGPVTAALVFTLKLALVVFGGLWLVYVVAANALLAIGLGRFADSPEVELEYASAYSLFPGDVVARDVRLAKQALTVEWSIAARRAHLRVDLGELLARRVHFTRVRADGFSFRMRLRVPRDEARAPRVAALPPVPPFDDPPIVADGPPSPRRPNAWTVAVDDSDVGVEEVWIQEVRFVGRARSHGGFSARMQHFVEVGPAHLDVASGVVTMGAHRVAHGVEGRVAFRLDPVDPMATHGLEVFRSASTKLTLDAQVDGVDAAEIFAPRARLEDGSGELHVAASVEHGVVLDGSEASYATRHVAVSIGPIGVRAEGDLALDAHVRAARGADGAARTEITAALPPSSIVRAGSRADAARIDAARFTAAFDDLELSGRGAFAGATVDVPRARVPDVALFAPEAGGPDVPVPERGAATARVHLEVDGELRGKGGVDVSVLGGAVRVKDVTVSGDSTASLDLTDFDLRRKRARFAGEADLVDAVIAREGRATRPMWLRAKLREGVIAVERGAPVDLRGALEVSDASELFPVFGAHGPAAWAPHLLGVHASAADVDLTHEGHALTLRFGARSGAVTAKGAVRFERGKRDGGVLVKDGPLAAGLSIATNGVDVHPQADAAWLRSRLAAIGRGSASR